MKRMSRQELGAGAGVGLSKWKWVNSVRLKAKGIIILCFMWESCFPCGLTLLILLWMPSGASNFVNEWWVAWVKFLTIQGGVYR